jgi:hypothetical protein
VRSGPSHLSQNHTHTRGTFESLSLAARHLTDFSDASREQLPLSDLAIISSLYLCARPPQLAAERRKKINLGNRALKLLTQRAHMLIE